jgi:hypothetical protein
VDIGCGAVTAFLVREGESIVWQDFGVESKQTVNVLVKRGKELHSPDRMYLNPSQIILVEPVGPNSKVMQLILEQMEQRKQQ